MVQGKAIMNFSNYLGRMEKKSARHCNDYLSFIISLFWQDTSELTTGQVGWVIIALKLTFLMNAGRIYFISIKKIDFFIS